MTGGSSPPTNLAQHPGNPRAHGANIYYEMSTINPTPAPAALIPQPATPLPLCVTFPTRFSMTYKRTFPKLSVLIRAYTGPVSPCRFSPKTTKNSKRPNPRPPQVLAQFPKPLCHLMSPSSRRIAAPKISPGRARAHTLECIAPARAPNGAPGCSHWWSKAPRSKPSATSGQRHRRNSTPAGVEESFECEQINHPKSETPQLIRA